MLRRREQVGRECVLIGHKGHPEVEGTMGQVGAPVHLVQSEADVAALAIPEHTPVAYITQTTLSVDDTADIVAALQRRYPEIHGPKKEDICYATTNRQMAVKAIAPGAKPAASAFSSSPAETASTAAPRPCKRRRMPGCGFAFCA